MMKGRSIPSWLIIVICSMGGLILACVLTYRTNEPTLIALPALPETAVAIEHIETGGFFRDDPYIQTADGQIYRFLEGRGVSFWEISPLPEAPDLGDECASQDYEAIVEEAPSVVECRAAQVYGEWCPGPIVSYAIDEDGLVWKRSRYRDSVCPFLIGFGMMILGPAGFVLGLVIVGVRWVVRAVARRRLEGD